MSTSTATYPMRNESGCRLQCMIPVISLLLALLAGCGGGGGDGAPTGVNTTDGVENVYTVTSDNYGLENATYLSCGKSNLGVVFRAAIASGLDDPNYQTVSRIDIAPGAAITPLVAYSLGVGAAPQFPGNIYFLNGHTSTLLRTIGGSISFTRYGGNTGDRISGSYSATLEDDNDPAEPTYTVAASFDFVVDSYGAVLPPPTSLALAAQPTYQSACASCHALGSYDLSATGAPDLSLKGGKVEGKYTAGQTGHQGVALTAGQIAGMKVLLNVY